MNDKRFLLVWTAFLTSSYCYKLDQPTDKLPTPNWAFLGSADGKGYYVETLPNEQGKTWEEAGPFCRSMGMGLAEILTTDQSNVFQTTTDPSIIDGQLGYWTAARDKGGMDQLFWSESRNATTSVIMWRIEYWRPRTCGYLNWPTGEGGRAVIFLESCEAKKGVVCQLDIPV